METINLISLFLILFTYSVLFLIFKFNNIEKVIFNLIFVWHLFFCLIYYYYTLNIPTDSNSYYLSSLKKYYDFKLGAISIINFTRIFSYQLNFSYLDCFIIFNFIGTLGILFFYKSLVQIKNNDNFLNNVIFYSILFLPSMYFWSSAIGKDVFSFLSISIFVWSSFNLNDRIKYSILSIFIMLLVRPHISSIMCFSMIMALIFYNNINLKNKFIYIFILFLILLNITNYSLIYVGMTDLISYYPFNINLNILSDFINIRENKFISETAGVEISNMNPIVKIFTYLYRPLPYEINSYFQLYVSIENVYLILLTLIGIFGFIFFNSKIITNQSIIMLVLYTIITIIILSFTSANLGINSRQKWMILPVILILIFQFSPFNKKTFTINKV